MNGHTPLSLDVRLALDRFELDVTVITTDRVTGIFGVSGAGKTTLLEIIAGLRRDARGRVVFGDTVWLDTSKGIDLPPQLRGIGYVPQDSLLFPHLDVRGNLRSGRKRAMTAGVPFEERLDAVVRVLELDDLLHRRPGTLSGGERQRVALGRALCSGPRLLLLDEPLASLDVALRRRVLPFLHRIEAEFDVPIIIVSHSPFEVQALCSDLIVLREGRVIARGEPHDALMQPAVFTLAEDEAFENLLPGLLFAGDDGVGTVGLGRNGTGPHVQVRASTAPPLPVPVLLGIAAEDILLAVQRPSLISARNIIPARLERCDTVGDWLLVRARVHDEVPPIAVEISRQAWEELGLGGAREVYLVFKSSSVRVYSER